MGTLTLIGRAIQEFNSALSGLDLPHDTESDLQVRYAERIMGEVDIEEAYTQDELAGIKTKTTTIRVELLAEARKLKNGNSRAGS